LYGDIIFKSNQSKNKNNNNNVLIKKEEFSNNIYFEDYEIKFQVIDNNGKEKFPKNDLIKLFDYDKIKRDILIRHRKDGDKIVPLGMNGSKKIKDIFMDLKIPRDDRDEIPIVCFDDEISWVVGCKTSQKFKITKDTKKILKIAFSRKG
ncbi:tRNA lysidine(34) synthetase TilS, partial [Clostridium sp.]